MSSISDQRKQELLTQLALSRLQMLDEAGELEAKTTCLFNISRRVKQTVQKHPVIFGVIGVGAGMLLARGVFKHFLKRHPHEYRGANHGAIKGALIPLWGMVVASAAPVVREFIADLVRQKISSLRSKR